MDEATSLLVDVKFTMAENGESIHESSTLLARVSRFLTRYIESQHDESGGVRVDKPGIVDSVPPQGGPSPGRVMGRASGFVPAGKGVVFPEDDRGSSEGYGKVETVSGGIDGGDGRSGAGDGGENSEANENVRHRNSDDPPHEKSSNSSQSNSNSNQSNSNSNQSNHDHHRPRWHRHDDVDRDGSGTVAALSRGSDNNGDRGDVGGTCSRCSALQESLRAETLRAQRLSSELDELSVVAAQLRGRTDPAGETSSAGSGTGRNHIHRNRRWDRNGRGGTAKIMEVDDDDELDRKNNNNNNNGDGNGDRHNGGSSDDDDRSRGERHDRGPTNRGRESVGGSEDGESKNGGRKTRHGVRHSLALAKANVAALTFRVDELTLSERRLRNECDALRESLRSASQDTESTIARETAGLALELSTERKEVSRLASELAGARVRLAQAVAERQAMLLRARTVEKQIAANGAGASSDDCGAGAGGRVNQGRGRASSGRDRGGTAVAGGAERRAAEVSEARRRTERAVECAELRGALVAALAAGADAAKGGRKGRRKFWMRVHAIAGEDGFESPWLRSAMNRAAERL